MRLTMRQQEKLSSLESYTIKQQVKYEQYQKQYGEAYGILVEKYSQKIMEATSKKQESVIQKIDPVIAINRYQEKDLQGNG